MFSFSFTLSSNNVFINFIHISNFIIYSSFNYLFSWIVVVICVILITYILHYFRWFYFILWFTLVFFVFFFAITTYVISFNYIFLFLFWEIMGVCWFFLISSFFFRVKTRFASFVAFFWNLAGDFALLFFIITSIILFLSMTLSFTYYFTVSFVFILLAIFAKSAVTPLHTWLYYAMEGPTPVSAFLHAAWMITAGVYLFFIFSIYINSYLWILCFLSIVYFSFNAMYYYDLKKIIASWTGSQMGYIILFFSFSYILNGLLLFSFHAMFKSYFFFIAGITISMRFDYQDFRIQGFSFFYKFFLLFCATALVGLFFFWCGIAKEVFVFKYLSIAILKSLFYIIFIFSFIYSFKLFLIKYISHIYVKNEVASFFILLIFGILHSLLGFCGVGPEAPLYNFFLGFVFAITLLSFILFLSALEFHTLLIDIYFTFIYTYCFNFIIFLLNFFLEIYRFCDYFFWFS